MYRSAFMSLVGLALAIDLAGCGGGADSQGHTIGASGGRIVDNGGSVTLDVPANAVDHDTVFSITPIMRGDAIAGSAYELEPDGTVFRDRLTVTIGYDPAALPAGTDERDLRVYSIGASGVPVVVPEQTVDAAAHRVTAGIAHFSIVYIGPAPQPRFDVHLLSETLIQIDAAPGTKILRAHVGACPPDTACSPHPVGCVEADFDLDPARRPIQTELSCVYAGAPPGECVGVPPGIQDHVYAAGFYCYRVQHTTPIAEVYSFGAQVVPSNPPPNFQAAANPANGSIVLSWTAIQPTLGDVTGYYVVRGDGRSFRLDRASLSQLEDTNVTAGMTYTYTIYTVNDAGFSRSPAQARPTPTRCSARTQRAMAPRARCRSRWRGRTAASSACSSAFRHRRSICSRASRRMSRSRSAGSTRAETSRSRCRSIRRARSRGCSTSA